MPQDPYSEEIAKRYSQKAGRTDLYVRAGGHNNKGGKRRSEKRRWERRGKDGET